MTEDWHLYCLRLNNKVIVCPLGFFACRIH